MTHRLTTAEILDALEGITEHTMNLARASLARSATRGTEQDDATRATVYREDVEASATRAEQAEATLREVLGSFSRITQQGITVGFQGAAVTPSDFTRWLTALDGPSPTPDDAPMTRCGCGLISCERAAALATSDVEIVNANDIPTDWARDTEPRCPARYTGPPPGVDIKWGARSDYRCDLRVHSRGTDHAARLGSEPFAWTDDIAVWPTSDAPSEPQQ